MEEGESWEVPHYNVNATALNDQRSLISSQPQSYQPIRKYPVSYDERARRLHVYDIYYLVTSALQKT